MSLRADLDTRPTRVGLPQPYRDGGSCMRTRHLITYDIVDLRGYVYLSAYFVSLNKQGRLVGTSLAYPAFPAGPIAYTAVLLHVFDVCCP